ncbi:FeoC-like transcriptional regulator [uncultured Thiodictyon sp.]|uniref:FeoC-like transcriptional regulator n=1 Tax=uncultured Thiodictyon sp. TaxID=1846217 RepID=UPI0025D33E14|nr:FeoC-like transcriptional regulator [uncultured Thiodictyon sp.]
MILSELTGYLAQHRRAPLIDLATHFDASPDALRGMLATLERRGRVRRIANGAACGSGCGKCDQSQVETYEWVSAGPARAD